MMEELKVSKVRNGTVIDHIRAGMAPAVLRILGIDRGFTESVVVAMNVQSQRLERKDIVKVENQRLDEEMLKRIAIIAPQATMNIIEEFEIIEKHTVSLPDELRAILRCPNRNCISNEPTERVDSWFIREPKSASIEFRCYYCEEVVKAERAELS